jgi:uncharacterized membrane protein YgdD (TMEM256/DUF423 family)
MHKIWLFLAALAGLTATMLAALAAHALPSRLDSGAMQMVRDTVSLQGWHAPALLGAGLLAARRTANGAGNLLAHAAAGCFALGLLLFCGAVYALALGGLHLPMVAPTGGFILMAGWVLLAAAAFRA